MSEQADNERPGGNAQANDPDYREIEWDEGVPMSEWHYTHRRAYILETELLEKGHPGLVNWAELARRFDKAKSTLHKDKQRLKDYLAGDVDDDRIDLIGQVIFKKGLRDLLTPTTEKKMRPDGSIVEIEKPPDYQAAAEFYRLWVDTLARRGKTEWGDPMDAGDEEGAVEGGLREVVTEVAGVAPEELDDLDDMPDRDKPPELVENAQEGG
jgi:hypothetical protein